jgi:hypothetical protein
MSYLYFALVFLFVFTIYSLVRVRRTHGAQENLTQARKDLGTAATIACAAASNAFKIQLNFTDESVDLLDSMITAGWGNTNDGGPISPNLPMEPPNDFHRSIDQNEFVLAAYLGELLVRNHLSHWEIDVARHPYPYVVFENKKPASPFDLIRAKFSDPSGFRLVTAYNALLAEVYPPAIQEVANE